MESSTPDPNPNPGPSPRRLVSYRGKHRARQDDLAHAQGQTEVQLVIPDHPLIPKGEPELVATPAALDELIAHLRQVGAFAYDSEFIGEQSYVPHICLIQVAAADHVALIDPLAGLELRPFYELLADPGLEKIVHAGQQDFEPVWRFLGKPPANIVDTQVVAGFLGRPYPIALWKLVQEFVGVELGKSPKFSQWDRRPLTDLQLRYAANDVRFLPALRAALGERVAPMGNGPWASEECNAMAQPSTYVFDAVQQSTRLRGSERLRRRELALLQALIAWRDQAARAMDVPPRTLLKDGILLEMARNPVQSLADLDRISGLPRPVEEAYGPAIVQMTEVARALPIDALPEIVRQELTPTEQLHADAAWAAILERCAQRQIDPAVFGSRSELARLFRRLVRGRDGSKSRLLRGWRRELIGDTIENAVAQVAAARTTRRRKRRPDDSPAA